MAVEHLRDAPYDAADDQLRAITLEIVATLKAHALRLCCLYSTHSDKSGFHLFPSPPPQKPLSSQPVSGKAWRCKQP